MSTFFCIGDRRSGDTRELFRSSCIERGISFSSVDAPTFDFAAQPSGQPGDLVYQVVGGAHADSVAAHIAATGTARLGASHRAVAAALPQLQLERAGVPAIGAMPCRGRNRGTIRRALDACGGLPVVVKVPGGQGGIGVMIAESWRSLISTLDFLAELDVTPTVARFVPDAVHWRCVTLGDRVLFSYRNELIDGDFRTAAPNEPAGYQDDAPAKVCTVALQASAALGVEFAGVDVLVGAEGPQVLEVNSPCYFAAAQCIGRADISGAIVEHLLARR